jgi:hypothetical protein
MSSSSLCRGIAKRLVTRCGVILPGRQDEPALPSPLPHVSWSGNCPGGEASGLLGPGTSHQRHFTGSARWASDGAGSGKFIRTG